MSAGADRALPLTSARKPSAADDPMVFADMFDAHAAHVFDYCYGLLNNRADAATATHVTLIAAHSLVGQLADLGRLRAWLLAMARCECMAEESARAPELGDLADVAAALDVSDDEFIEAGAGEISRMGADGEDESPVRSALLSMDDLERDSLNLVYRHGVSPAEFPTVLGIPSAEAQTLLTAAETKFELSANSMSRDDVEPDPKLAALHPALQQLSALPLACIPASVWRRTARVVIDPKFRAYRDAVGARARNLGPDGFPVQTKPSGDPGPGIPGVENDIASDDVHVDATGEGPDKPAPADEPDLAIQGLLLSSIADDRSTTLPRRRLVVASIALAGLITALAVAGVAGDMAFGRSAGNVATHSGSHAPTPTPDYQASPSPSAAANSHAPRRARHRGHGSTPAGILPGPQVGQPTPKPTTHHSATPTPTSRISPPTSPSASPSSSTSP